MATGENRSGKNRKYLAELGNFSICSEKYTACSFETRKIPQYIVIKKKIHQNYETRAEEKGSKIGQTLENLFVIFS